MLPLFISGERQWDDEKEEFLPAMKDYTLQLEHSLLSISKWEEIYHKPFLSTELTYEEVKVYAKCMTINKVPDEVYERIGADEIDKITSYIQDPHTATWFSDNKAAHTKGRMNGMNNEIITSEIVYYWMTQMNIPVEFQKWHLNRLLTLIRVISIKNDPKGGKTHKMTNAERKALNEANKAKYHTRG